jgi:CDP-diglyceride synthetase
MTARAGQWKDLPRRVATIGIGLPVAWWIWSHDILRPLFFQGTHAVCAFEWSSMTTMKGSSLARWIFPLVSLALANVQGDTVFLTFITAAVSVTCTFLPKQQMPILQGLFLLTIPFRAWHNISVSFVQTVSLLLTVWNCDNGALIVGRLFGGTIVRNKPAWLRRISPSKSIEGLLGAILLGTATYAGLPRIWRFLGKWMPTIIWSGFQNWPLDVDVGLALSLAAVMGDLWESALKRQYAVKDTSKLLPGHGGVLDRFDSSLLAVLVYQVYLETVRPIRGY